jgi:hypothetical protein
MSYFGGSIEPTLWEMRSNAAPGTWTPFAASADSGVLSAAAATVRQVRVTNTSAAAVYLLLFDTAAVPADGVAPRLPAIMVYPGEDRAMYLGGLACANGLCWASSSTANTKTITATTPLQVAAELAS